MILRTCIFTASVAIALPAFAQNNSPNDTPPPKPAETIPAPAADEKLEPLVEPGAETRPADQKASSVKFEVESGLDLGTDESGRVVVESVKAKGDAANAGIKEGDFLVAIDDMPINSAVSLAKFLKAEQDVNAHILKLRRGEKDFEVTLGKKVDMLGMLIFSDKSQRPLVRRVEKGSPAERAGIRRGDLITGISGRAVESINQFTEFAVPLVRKMSEGQEIPLRLVRDGDTIDVDVIRPEDAALPLIPAPKETMPARPQVVKERVVEKHNTVMPIQQADDDYSYLGGLSGYRAEGGGSALALDFSNNSNLTPFSDVAAVAATLHHVGNTTRVALNVGAPTNNANTTDQNMDNMDMNSDSHMGTAGFVLVQTNGTQSVVNARLAGFVSGQYRLAVYEFGDCGDIMNGSAGQGAVELGTFSVDRSGRGFLQTALNNVNPQALLGRVVAVIPVSVNNNAPTTTPNSNAPLDQNIRTGDPRTRPRATINNNSGQAMRGTPGQFFMNVESKPMILLAQAPKAGPSTPAASGGTGNATQFQNPANEPPRTGKPNVPRVPPTTGTQNPAPGTPGTTINNGTNRRTGVNPNLANEALLNNLANNLQRTTNRAARMACGVFGLSNPGRPIIPLDPTFNPLQHGTVNQAVPSTDAGNVPVQPVTPQQ